LHPAPVTLVTSGKPGTDGTGEVLLKDKQDKWDIQNHQDILENRVNFLFLLPAGLKGGILIHA